MKRQFMVISILIVLNIGSMPIMSDGGSGYRAFFDDTYSLKTTGHEISDYSNGDKIRFTIYYATKTLLWNILRSKDLFISVNITYQNANSGTEIYVADLYFEQIISGGVLDGINFYYGNLAIGDNNLIRITPIIPYLAHVQLPGLGAEYIDFDYTNRRRTTGEATGIQVSLEYQLFVKYNGSLYQSYLVDTFIIMNDSVSVTSYQKTSNTAPAFEWLTILAIFGIIIVKKVRR